MGDAPRAPCSSATAVRPRSRASVLRATAASMVAAVGGGHASLCRTPGSWVRARAVRSARASASPPSRVITLSCNERALIVSPGQSGKLARATTAGAIAGGQLARCTLRGTGRVDRGERVRKRRAARLPDAVALTSSMANGGRRRHHCAAAAAAGADAAAPCDGTVEGARREARPPRRGRLGRGRGAPGATALRRTSIIASVPPPPPPPMPPPPPPPLPPRWRSRSVVESATAAAAPEGRRGRAGCATVTVSAAASPRTALPPPLPRRCPRSGCRHRPPRW